MILEVITKERVYKKPGSDKDFIFPEWRKKCTDPYPTAVFGAAAMGPLKWGLCLQISE